MRLQSLQNGNVLAIDGRRYETGATVVAPGTLAGRPQFKVLGHPATNGAQRGAFQMMRGASYSHYGTVTSWLKMADDTRRGLQSLRNGNVLAKDGRRYEMGL